MPELSAPATLFSSFEHEGDSPNSLVCSISSLSSSISGLADFNRVTGARKLRTELTRLPFLPSLLPGSLFNHSPTPNISYLRCLDTSSIRFVALVSFSFPSHFEPQSSSSPFPSLLSLSSSRKPFLPTPSSVSPTAPRTLSGSTQSTHPLLRLRRQLSSLILPAPSLPPSSPPPSTHRTPSEVFSTWTKNCLLRTSLTR